MSRPPGKVVTSIKSTATGSTFNANKLPNGQLKTRARTSRGGVGSAKLKQARKPAWNDNITNLDQYRLKPHEVDHKKELMASRNAALGKLHVYDKDKRSPETVRKVHGQIFREMLMDFERDIDSMLNRSTKAMEDSQLTLNKTPRFKYKPLEVVGHPSHRVNPCRRKEAKHGLIGDAEHCHKNKMNMKVKTAKMWKSLPSSPVSPEKVQVQVLNDTPKVVRSRTRRHRHQEQITTVSDSDSNEVDNVEDLRQILGEIQDDLDQSAHREAEKENEAGALCTFTADLLTTIKALGGRYHKMKKELQAERQLRHGLEEKVQKQEEALVMLTKEVQSLQSSQMNIIKSMSVIASRSETSTILPSSSPGSETDSPRSIQHDDDLPREEIPARGNDMGQNRDKQPDMSLSLGSDGTEYAEVKERDEDTRVRVVVDSEQGADPSKVVIVLAPPRRWKSSTSEFCK